MTFVEDEVTVETDVPLELPADRFRDRELSWLAFNTRVLDLARDDKRVPLLERAKFLAIFSSNLDEFFMVRVAGLKRRIAAGVAVPSASGLHAARPARRDPELAPANWCTDQGACSPRRSAPHWPKHGIEILRWDQLTAPERDKMTDLFESRIFPVLTPLAVDPSHPFPYISGLSVNLAVLLKNPITGSRQFARVKVPTILSRFIPLGGGSVLVPLEDVIAAITSTRSSPACR